MTHQQTYHQLLSLQVASYIEAEPNYCFGNAWDAVAQIPELFFEGRYVEGWSIMQLTGKIWVIEHAWAELPPPTYGIVDPSAILLPLEAVPLYYPGMRLRREETLSIKGEWLPHVRDSGAFGEDGMGHPAYRAAYEEAVRVAKELASSSIPPMEVLIRPARGGDERRQVAI
jgi:hypothetical protein